MFLRAWHFAVVQRSSVPTSTKTRQCGTPSASVNLYLTKVRSQASTVTTFTLWEKGYALASRSLKSISPLLLRRDVYIHVSLYSKANKKARKKILAHLSTATDICSRLYLSDALAEVRHVTKACLPLQTSHQIIKARDGSEQPVPITTSTRLAATCINFDGMLVPYRSTVSQACQHCRCCFHHSQQASHGTEAAHTGKDYRLC